MNNLIPTQYRQDFSNIPARFTDYFETLEAQKELAFKKLTKGDDSLTKSVSGWIKAVEIDGEPVLVMFVKHEDPDGISTDLNGWWISAEWNNLWHGDPLPTLKRAVNAFK